MKPLPPTAARMAPEQANAQTTIRGLMDAALAMGVSPNEARSLLTHATGWRREVLLAFDERQVDAGAQADFLRMASARAAGEPLAYLVGVREFFSRRFRVAPGVLIPRPETELLVEFALERAQPKARVLDLGTGSGAIAVTIAAERSDLAVHACDISQRALEIARDNNLRLAQGRVHIFMSDWFAQIPAEERFDVMVSNPPYIRAADPHLNQGDLRFEPPDALTDHSDGLAAVRILVRDGHGHLAPGGWFAVEHGYDQAGAVRELLRGVGYTDVASRTDLAGIERISIGKRV